MNRTKRKFMLPQLRRRRLALGLLAASGLAIIAALFFIAPQAAMICLGILPMLGIVIPEEEFQTKVLKAADQMEETSKGITAIRTNQEKLLGDYGRLDGDVKKSIEDLTKLKNTANEQQANFNKFQRQLLQVEQLLATHARLAFGDPVQRVIHDDNMRTRFNAAVRLAVSRPGDALEKGALSLTKALGEDTSPGSNLIDDKLAGQIYDLLSDFGIWNTVEVVPASTKNNKFPVDTADPVAQVILTEGGTISDDANITGTSVTAEAEVVALLLNVAFQLLEDAEYDVTSWLMKKFARAYAKRLDFLTFRADGTADGDNGSMTGILNAGTAVATGAGSTKVELTTLDDWINCMLGAAEVVMARPARWWMHHFVLARAILVRDTTGRPIFQTALEAPSPGAVGTILGRPVTLGFVLPTANVGGTKVLAYGDPSGQVNGVRKTYTFEASDHHKWNTLQRSFRGHGRFASKNRAATAFAVMQLAAV